MPFVYPDKKHDAADFAFGETDPLAAPYRLQAFSIFAVVHGYAGIRLGIVTEVKEFRGRGRG